jgi:hypothetical protein
MGTRSDCAGTVTVGCVDIPWPGEATTVRHQLAEGPVIRNWFGGLVDNMRDASGQLYMRNWERANVGAHEYRGKFTLRRAMDR